MSIAILMRFASSCASAQRSVAPRMRSVSGSTSAFSRPSVWVRTYAMVMALAGS